MNSQRGLEGLLLKFGGVFEIDDEVIVLKFPELNRLNVKSCLIVFPFILLENMLFGLREEVEEDDKLLGRFPSIVC